MMQSVWKADIRGGCLERMEAEQKKEEEESGEELFCGQKRLRKVSAKISQKTVLAICQGSSGI